jgi:hypothetical protein
MSHGIESTDFFVLLTEKEKEEGCEESFSFAVKSMHLLFMDSKSFIQDNIY